MKAELAAGPSPAGVRVEERWLSGPNRTERHPQESSETLLLPSRDAAPCTNQLEIWSESGGANTSMLLFIILNTRF